MKTKRIIAWTLCALMILLSFAGCSAGGTSGEGTTAAEGTTSASNTDTSETTAAAGSEINLNGYEFTLGNPGREWSEDPENALQEAMMKQYEEIEAKYNCVISSVDVGDTSETLVTAGISGENLADFIRCKQNAWAPAALKQIIRPLETEEIAATGLNVNDENQVDLIYTQLSTFEGHVWTVSFSGEYFVPYFGHAYFFNKKLLNEAGYTDTQMYQAVRDFTWDYAMFEEICRAVSKDIDTDGVNDIEGLTMADGEAELMSNKIGLVYNKDGKWLTGFDTPEFATALNFYLEILMDKDIVMEDRAGLNNDGRRQTFYDGKAAFGCLYGADFGDSNGCESRMMDDYGMLPIPHGPDAEVYPHTIPDLWGFALQYNNKNWETSCLIMAEIGNRMTDPENAAETYKSFFRDEASYEILTEYCLKNAVIQSSRFSPQIDATLDVIAELVFTQGVAAATEQAAQVMQSAINDLFGYTD